ncbi:MAG: hypothetical protein WDO14_06935 [Bacteroidota bacterium]
MSPFSFNKGRWAFFIYPHIKMETNQLIALFVAAAAGTLGIIKFKLIEELVKKISSDDKNIRLNSIMLLFFVVALLGLTTSYFSGTVGSATEPEGVVQGEIPIETKPAQKSDLEVKVEAVKEGVALTKDLISTAKENKQRKDSVFEAAKSERWVVQINDWIDDEDRIVEIYKSLSMPDNVKLLKIKKQCLFIMEDQVSKEQLELSLDSLRQTLPGLQLKLFNINSITTRKKNTLTERFETFGRRKNKVKIRCLVLD